MKYLTRKMLTTTVVIAILVALASLWKKLEAGYCVSQRRILRNEEIIAPALDDLIKREKLEPETAAEYLKKNPTCCSVQRNPQQRTFFDILTGYNFTEVEINYEKSRISNIQGSNRFYQSYSSVGTCGNFFKEEYGTDTPTLEQAIREK